MKNTWLIADTETNFSRYIFDIAWSIALRTGKILTSENYLVKEIITDPDCSKSFYQKKHYSDYIPMLARGDVDLMAWNDITALLHSHLFDYDCKAFCAYNAGFDLSAIRKTELFLNEEITPCVQEILDYDFLCIQKFMADTTAHTATYSKTALANGWVTAKAKLPSLKAENLYRYVTANPNFEEEHTALEDVLIETALLAHAFRKHSKVPYNQFHHWTDTKKFVEAVA